MMDSARERLVKSWESQKLFAPSEIIEDMLQAWIDPKYVSAEKMLNEHMSITLEDIKNYFNDNSFFVSGLIEGSITQNNAEKIFGIPACIIQNTHNAEQEPKIKYIDDSKSIESCKYYHPNAAETNSCVAIFCKYKYLAFDDEYYMNISMYRILSTINYDKFFNQLRTLEQLGYAVSSYQKYFGESSYQLYGQIYVIQTATYTTTHLCERINDFIIKFLDVLETMSDEKFEEYKMNTILTINEAHESLKSEFGDDVNALVTKHGFDYVKQLTKYTKEITKDDLVKFYREYFIDNRSGWTLEVVGNTDPQDEETDCAPKRRRIEL
jgi:secreted Zn-dependent insulinase-like peptidase